MLLKHRLLSYTTVWPWSWHNHPTDLLCSMYPATRGHVFWHICCPSFNTMCIAITIQCDSLCLSLLNCLFLFVCFSTLFLIGHVVKEWAAKQDKKKKRFLTPKHKQISIVDKWRNQQKQKPIMNFSLFLRQSRPVCLTWWSCCLSSC